MMHLPHVSKLASYCACHFILHGPHVHSHLVFLVPKKASRRLPCTVNPAINLCNIEIDGVALTYRLAISSIDWIDDVFNEFELTR